MLNENSILSSYGLWNTWSVWKDVGMAVYISVKITVLLTITFFGVGSWFGTLAVHLVLDFCCCWLDDKKQFTSYIFWLLEEKKKKTCFFLSWWFTYWKEELHDMSNRVGFFCAMFYYIFPPLGEKDIYLWHEPSGFLSSFFPLFNSRCWLAWKRSPPVMLIHLLGWEAK